LTPAAGLPYSLLKHKKTKPLSPLDLRAYHTAPSDIAQHPTSLEPSVTINNL